jgi:UDP-N-acetylglucosamine 2-epimerase (non-hydrolysing)
MRPPLIHLIAAVRPNFMKAAPLWHALKEQDWCTPALVHTGQHYDVNMSDNFVRISDCPIPPWRPALRGRGINRNDRRMIPFTRAAPDERTKFAP